MYDNKGEENTSSTSEKKEKLSDGCGLFPDETVHKGARNVAETLKKSVRKSLVADKRRIADVTVKDIGAFLENLQGKQSDLQGAYSILKRWYQHTSGWKTYTPIQIWRRCWETTRPCTSWKTPPPVWTIPTQVTPFGIDDGTPTDGEIEAAFIQLRRNRAGGHTHLREEHLQKCLREVYP